MSSTNKRTFKQRKSPSPKEIKAMYKADAGPAWTSEEKELMRDMFSTLYYQNRMKGGEKTAVSDNLDTLVTELANHYNQFQEYLDMDGGAAKKRKYDVIYHMVKDLTEKFFGNGRADKQHQPQKHSQHDEQQLFGSVSSPNEEQYQASAEKTEQRHPDDKVDDKSLDSESQHADQSQMDMSFSIETPNKTAQTKDTGTATASFTLGDLLNITEPPHIQPFPTVCRSRIQHDVENQVA